MLLTVVLAVGSGLSYGQAANLSGSWVTPNGAGAYRFVDDNKRVVLFPVNDAQYGTGIYGHGLGWLQRTGTGQLLDGELYLLGCWFHLSLEESENGTVLAGTSRIIYKKSSRQCLSVLTKAARNEAKKNGEAAPSRFTLIRR